MDLPAPLLHLSAIHFLMAMVPGPNTVVVSYAAAAQSRRAGLTAASGVMVASVIWVALSLGGIGLVLMQAGELYTAARLLGAAYLVYVGIKLFRAGRPEDTAAALNTRPRFRKSPFVGGLLTTISNPKSAVFWTSVFTLVVPGNAPIWFYGAIVALIAVQSMVWYGAVALMLSTPVARANYARFARWLDRLAGGAMILLGMKVADDVRRELAARSL
tara:strand:- start:709 stop:1356 length:648 start_codon:yes stop_codon:yes gene_type:complete